MGEKNQCEPVRKFTWRWQSGVISVNSRSFDFWELGCSNSTAPLILHYANSQLPTRITRIWIVRLGFRPGAEELRSQRATEHALNQLLVFPSILKGQVWNFFKMFNFAMCSSNFSNHYNMLNYRRIVRTQLEET